MSLAVRRLLLFSAAVVLLAIGTAAPASAHPTLLTTTPEAGYSVATAPSRISMVFDEPVTIEPHGVQVKADDSSKIPTSDVIRDLGGRRLAVALTTKLKPGRYVVTWELTAQDGDVVDSGFDFAVGTGSADLQGRGGTATNALPLVVTLRWLFFLALAGVLGSLVGERIARRCVPDATVPRSLIRSAAVLGALATGGLLLHLAATTGWSGRAAVLLAIETGGLLLTALIGGRKPWWMIAPPLLVVVIAETLRNHLGTQRGPIGAVLIAIHLVAIAMWIGALAHLLRVAHANRGTPIRSAFVLYARIALWLFLLVAASGTAGAVLLIPTFGDLTSTAYGRVLLVKLWLVATVAALAWWARRRLSGDRGRVGKPVRAEVSALIAVLATSALLISLPTPAPASQEAGYPPPVTGPVVRLGTLTGQIAVGIAASQGQLEVRTRVPDDSVQLGESDPPSFRVTARTTVTGRPAATVALRPCGPGCFIGPVSWPAGVTVVDIRADAPGWQGGAAVFQVRWVPHISSGLLAKVRAAMDRQRNIRVVESVTSDTSRPAPPSHTLTVDGPEFLDSEPYSDPPDPETITRSQPGGHTIVTFGLPAEGTYAELELDASYRIVTETLAAPKHLTHRSFTYPGK